ncbi:MAG TPA: DUF3572 domain-containing protein [Alphaproteobacteria bacterium]|nr:DUF3572 domain-containing protein [Alphaproteobacteria bacterium]
MEAAETLALEALTFLASDERRLGALLAQAGWTLPELRARLGDPHVLAGILDFVLSDERLVVGFCESSGCAPEMPMRARRALPGSGFEG